MFGWQAAKVAVEAEGIYIGGWGLQNVFWPKRMDGHHASSQDRIEHVVAIQDWDADEERKLVRKLDARVLFPCCIIYFLAYLDRANMGFVNVLQAGKPSSFEETLHLKGADFNWAVSVTYFMVTVLLIPSNLLMKKFSGKFYFPVIMILWGTIVMCIGAVHSKAGLLAARFFLGVPESGVVPACIMYFSFWYKPHERAWRIGIFHAANSLASGVGGFLAVAIDHLNGRAGLESWRWLFIIEGAMPIVCAVPVHFLLLTFPEDSKALTERERYIAINRFGRGATRKTDVTWDWPAFFNVMSRPSTYVFFVSYLCLLIVAVALGTFLPTILKVFAKFSSTKANEYSSSVYFVAIVVYAFWSWHSDWTRERIWHYIIPAAMAIPCFAIWTHVATQKSFGNITPIQLYGLAYLGNMVSIAQPAALAYRTSTLYGASEQAIGGATAIASLSIASIIGPQIFPSTDAPWYLPGFAAASSTIAFTIISFASLPLWLMWEAKRRKAKTGHAMPLRAMEDAEHSTISAANLARLYEQKALEEKRVLDLEKPRHIEEIADTKS
ncbi:uncharacterized protein Z519_04343 [Cladophialophora bantiana CBS 173.52]|uniref:Major facilitator superfamily (MFS) profile domain-containing protein n=1 Tax=Cladophialophora bantiana (strain ATCC 10958 / CBS 173.52 / CDC B-1940 / NIH 8579) TaxID=1442370 RepID=A0A0D2G6X5_CLAB1|nr:uncharacterized protein Z519_04343 [Cladophialophora bantiana CBS 173.52]KIW94367.1 hypothetical protein Z519_04343 [Cladophialophora bantiana CBS 173.52]